MLVGRHLASLSTGSPGKKRTEKLEELKKCWVSVQVFRIGHIQIWKLASARCGEDARDVIFVAPHACGLDSRGMASTPIRPRR